MEKTFGRRPDSTLPWVWLPLEVGGVGGGVALLFLIGQLTLLYLLFPPFWGDEEAAACGYIKLPGRGGVCEVLANRDSRSREVCERPCPGRQRLVRQGQQHSCRFSCQSQLSHFSTGDLGR